jgi:hypothetical protein
MRLHRGLVLGVVASTLLVPTWQAHAVTVSGTASFSDTGSTKNNLNFVGTFSNPSFSVDLSASSPTITLSAWQRTPKHTKERAIAQCDAQMQPAEVDNSRPIPVNIAAE